jgi:hypothetical protein
MIKKIETVEELKEIVLNFMTKKFKTIYLLEYGKNICDIILDEDIFAVKRYNVVSYSYGMNDDRYEDTYLPYLFYTKYVVNTKNDFFSCCSPNKIGDKLNANIECEIIDKDRFYIIGYEKDTNGDYVLQIIRNSDLKKIICK